jgi:XTP/dITP diphosphohydrolase
MMRLVFATNNRHKLAEIKKAIDTSVPGRYTIVGLNELGFHDELPETADTLEGNAIEKVTYFYNRFKTNCFADDTGLEVFSLNNRPGVFSARYAGPACNFDDNINKLLSELSGVDQRGARFRTVIALILKDQTYLFEGEIEGEITISKYGKNGFGYDPVFRPQGYTQTFAEMDLENKNRISHRAQALNKLIGFLKQ